MVSLFDLTTPTGFCGFLRMQSNALRTLAPLATEAASATAAHDLLIRAETDLAGLAAPSSPPAPVEEPLHPKAIDYVVSGSRLGTQVLRKRWLAAEDPHVRQANAYFTAPNYIDVWKSFSASAEAMSANGPEADHIIRDANRVFQIYIAYAKAA